MIINDTSTAAFSPTWQWRAEFAQAAPVWNQIACFGIKHEHTFQLKEVLLAEKPS